MHLELAAGTPAGWFQIASYACFVTIFLRQSLQVRQRTRVNPIKLGGRRKGRQGLMEALLFAVVNVWGFLVVLHALPVVPAPWPWLFGPGLRMPAAAVALGAVVVLLSFAIFIVSLRQLNSSWRLGIDAEHPGRLVTTGIYAHSRNPIYAFFMLYFAGILLMNGSLVFLLLLVAAAPLLHRQALSEERFLARVFGGEYGAYRQRVGRYLTLRLPTAGSREPAKRADQAGCS